MILKESTPIGEEETSGELFDRLAGMGADLLIKTVSAIENGQVCAQAQQEDQATYAHMLSKEEARIDWTLPARQVHNLVRGMNPWPSAYTFLRGKRVKIHSCRVCDDLSGAPGALIQKNGELFVCCGQGAVRILSLQPENSRRMEGRAYLLGHPVQGEAFE